MFDEGVVSLHGHVVNPTAEGRDMERINLYEFYELGRRLQPLARLHGNVSLNQASGPLFGFRWQIETMRSASTVSLKMSRRAADDLHARINGLMEKYFYTSDGENLDTEKDWNTEMIPEWEISSLTGVFQRFEHILAAELRESATYFVPSRGIFETSGLVDRAENHIPGELHKFVDDRAMKDFQAAGKCLAFGLSTASGFHMLRAVEVVLDGYYRKLAGDGAKDCQSWYEYIEELRAMGKDETRPTPDPKTIRNISQIKDLDRNPLMHPRVFLDETEALVLFNIGTNAIIGMAGEMMDLDGQTELSLVSKGGDG